MRSLLVGAALLAALIIAGCGGSTPAHSPLAPSPSVGIVLLSASPAPSAATPSLQPSASHKPIGSPEPSQSSHSARPSPRPSAAPSAKPSPTAAPLSRNEKLILAGIRRDAAVDCAPRRTGLPARAIAGIECSPNSVVVDRVGFYLFASSRSLVRTYFERMAAEGVPTKPGECVQGEGEYGYMPSDVDNLVPDREGCFLNEYGVANYRATIAGSRILVGVLGTNGDMAALSSYAWKGQQDAPGTPTIWLDTSGY